VSWESNFAFVFLPWDHFGAGVKTLLTDFALRYNRLVIHISKIVICLRETSFEFYSCASQHLNMSDARNNSKDSNASDALSDAESIISFNEGGLRTMEDERISTPRYVYEAKQTIEALAEEKNLIETPKSVANLDVSLVLKAMLTSARETGGESSVRYTVCAICSCKEVTRKSSSRELGSCTFYGRVS
jgi:hypothetical protein